MPPPSPRTPRPVRDPLRRALQLLALGGFAAWPLLEIIALHPEFLVAHAAGPVAIAGLALGWSAVPALLALGLAGLVRSPRVSSWIFRLGAGVLVAAALAPTLARLLPDRSALWGAALLLVGAVGAGLHTGGRWRRVPALLAAGLAAFFPLWFLLRPPISSLLQREASAPPEAAASGSSALSPVVVVVFDALSVTSLMDAEGWIDATRFPAFAELARGATWYRNTAATSDRTTLALPALMTGRAVRGSAPPIANHHVGSLFTLLGSRYRLRVVEPVTDLCPRSLCGRKAAAPERRELLLDSALLALHVALPRALHERLPPLGHTWRFGRTWRGRPGRARHIFRGGRLEDFDAFLTGLEADAHPTLHFGHFVLPHAPYELYPSGRRYEPVALLPGLPGSHVRPALEQGRWSDAEAAVLESHRMYLLQAGAVDGLVGRLLLRLHEQGLYDRALLVVTADHGVCFEPGEFHRSVSATNAGEIAAVPLFVKLPGQTRGEIDDRLASTLDVTPTLAAALGLEPFWPVEGRSLLAPASRAERPRWIHRRGGGAGIFPVPATPPAGGRALRTQLARFGAGGGWAPLFRAGPAGARVGHPLAALPGRPLAPPEAAPRAGALPPAPLPLPAVVRGTLPPRTHPGPHDVAIAADGVVRVTTRSYREPGGRGWVFTTLLPEAAFTGSAPRLDAWLLDRGGAGLAPAPRGRVRLAGPGGHDAVVTFE